MSTSTFVTMQRDQAQWSVHAQIVQAIVADHEWDGGEPIDLSQALGLTPSAADRPHPVLVLRRTDGTSPIRALGAVKLRQLEMPSVWQVPELVRNPAKRQTVSGVAFPPGEMPLLVLDPILLLALAEEHAEP